MRFSAYCLSKMGEVIRAHIADLSERDLPEGDVLVNVEWSAINFKDAMVTRPGEPGGPSVPIDPGGGVHGHDRRE